MAAQVALPSTGSQVLRSSLHKTGAELYGPTTTFLCTSRHFSSPRLEAVQDSHCFTLLRRLKNAGRGRIQRFGSSSLKQTKKERCRVARAQVTETNSSPNPNSPPVTLQAKLDGPTGVLSNFTSVLQELPVKRIAIWAIVIGASYQMRAFLGVSMGTFILAFIGNALVAEVEKVLPGRRKLVVV